MLLFLESFLCLLLFLLIKVFALFDFLQYVSLFLCYQVLLLRVLPKIVAFPIFRVRTFFILCLTLQLREIREANLGKFSARKFTS